MIRLYREENFRLEKITIALGIIGNLAYYMENPWIHISNNSWTFLYGSYDLYSGINTAFTDTAVAATTVAVVVAPLERLTNYFQDPIGFKKAELAEEALPANSAAQELLESLLEEKPQTPPGPTSLEITVLHNSCEKPFVNGKDEYHIARGSSIQLSFKTPGFNNNDLPPFFYYFYEPSTQRIERNLTGINYMFFDINRKTDGNFDEFQIEIEHLLRPDGYFEDGKTEIGILFDSDITINGKTQGVYYKLFHEKELTLHNDMVVIRLCNAFQCPECAE